MRRLSIVAAIGAVIALAAACEPGKVTGARWKMQACDQARIDLAKSMVSESNPTGRPAYRDTDSESLQTATWESWFYEATDSNTVTHVKTLTTTEYYFEWNTARASSAPGQCFRDTTATVDTL